VELAPIPQNNPPGLPKSYPQQDSPASRAGLSKGNEASGAKSSEASVPSHKIIDGDSLPALAARYLGDADRAGEIFEANRNVLGSPDILPLGRELRIPAKHERQAEVPEEPAKGP
jgi:nucleoid-associated protein YgaU